MINLSIQKDLLEETTVRWALAMKKDGRTALIEMARRVTRMVISLTPPASAKATGRDAYMQGKRKIRRNLTAVMAPRTLKHKRREEWPNIASVWRARAVWRDNGVGVRVTRGRIAYVDRQKFLAFEKEKLAKIGRMASGWLAGAQLLGVSVLSWISRHGSGRGWAQIIERSGQIGIKVGNLAPGLSPNVTAEMARRIPYAQAYVERGARANIHGMALRTAAAAGFRIRRGGMA